VYEEIYETEDKISECELRMESAKKDAYTQDNIYQILLAFDKFIDIMDQEDKRKMMECLISEIQLYPKETWQEGQCPIKYIKYTFPVTNEVRQTLGEKVSTVETIVLLSKLHAKQNIEVELKMSEMDLTAAESKATYEEIKDYVLEHTGLKVSSLYIAQVKEKCGIIERANYNLPKSENFRQPKCPPEKEVAIREALKHFRMI